MTHDAVARNAGDAPKSNRGLRHLLMSLHVLQLAKSLHWGIRQTGPRIDHFVRRLTKLRHVGSYVAALLLRFDRSPYLTFDFDELERVCSELDKKNLTYWISGGWGIDVLVGSQTKRHGDLDIVLDAFDENFDAFDRVVTDLGYSRRAPLGGSIWFPQDAVYEDAHSHRIEVLGIDWQRVATAIAEVDLSPDDDSSTSGAARFTTSGVFGMRTLPVLSREAQRILHTGYQRRREDVLADDVLDMIERNHRRAVPGSSSVATAVDSAAGSTSTLLLIPLFSFPPELWKLCTTLHNDLDAIPPHVTLAYPFLHLSAVNDDVIDELTRFFADESPFDFDATAIRWFDQGVVYVEPSASDRLRRLIEGLQERFPDFHPYDDAFDAIIPHITLSQHGSYADRKMLANRATPYLPISLRASHVWLMSNHRRSDVWSILDIFQFRKSPREE